MWMRIALALSFCLLLGWALSAQRDRTLALEIGRGDTAFLPLGKEADGLPGDFVLRNDKIHALVSGAQPYRRANMSTEYDAVLQGCLYDLDVLGAENDQLTALRPGGESGPISYVRVVDDGSSGTAVVEAVRTAAMGEGLYTRHEYRLERDWEYLLVTSTYRNDSSAPKVIRPAPVWKGLDGERTVGVVRVADSIDPFDKRSYGVAPADASPWPEEVTLQPGADQTFRVRVAVADSPVAAYGVLAAASGPTGEVVGTVKDADGRPAPRGALQVDLGGVEPLSCLTVSVVCLCLVCLYRCVLSVCLSCLSCLSILSLLSVVLSPLSVCLLCLYCLSCMSVLSVSVLSVFSV